MTTEFERRRRPTAGAAERPAAALGPFAAAGGGSGGVVPTIVHCGSNDLRFRPLGCFVGAVAAT